MFVWTTRDGQTFPFWEIIFLSDSQLEMSQIEHFWLRLFKEINSHIEDACPLGMLNGTAAAAADIFQSVKYISCIILLD